MGGPPPTMPQPLANNELVLPQGGPLPPSVPMMQPSVPPPSLPHVSDKYVRNQFKNFIIEILRLLPS